MATSLAISLPGLSQVVDPPVHVEVYDGPLDLLLLLVRREGVDIREIPIARICDAYLGYLDAAEPIDVEVAGDYLLLAATLCQLKARELLPKAANADKGEVEEELDPREALVRRLLEYERYRAAAEALGQLELVDRDVFTRPAVELSVEEQPVDRVVDVVGLLALFYEVMEAHAAPPPEHFVQRETLSVSERARWVLAWLEEHGDTLLAELFVQDAERRGRIFTFLAVLEMARLQLLDIRQLFSLGAVRLTARSTTAEADFSALPEAL